jgi:hypothetical protein
MLALSGKADRRPELAEAGRAHVVAQHGPDNFARLEALHDRQRGAG